jgi:uncharacterized protein YjbI with pentapeptide repeats
LPILNIKVPLLPFYIIAPLLYLVFHFYLLMMLQLLARTAAPFETQLLATLPIEADRELYRARVENALFLQLLIGMKDERAGVNSLLLALIALITIVLAPLATLILLQLQFLPYHSFGITWWQRALVLADPGIVFFMWRFFYYSGVENPVFLLRDRPQLRSRPVLIAILCVLVAATGWLSLWGGVGPASRGSDGSEGLDFAATEKGVVFGLFPDRLKLNDETIVGETKLEETKKEMTSRNGGFVPTIKLDERDLQAADLSGADLRGVSLNGAAMRDANLTDTRLDGARLSCDRRGDSAICAQLQGAKLYSAHLQGADLRSTDLRGAKSIAAHLQGADLFDARLQGSDLNGSEMQGAHLAFAHLQGADLSVVDLTFAQLQGADLEEAQLQGADLSLAQLQGTNLKGADLSETALDRTLVFRTDISDANLSTAAIRSVHADPVTLSETGDLRPLERAAFG